MSPSTMEEMRTLLSRRRSRSEAVAEIDAACSAGRMTMVAFLNLNLLTFAEQDPRLRGALAEAVLLNDGLGANLARRLLLGEGFLDNLNGTDFVPHYLDATAGDHRIYLVGGRPGVAARAASALQSAFPRHRVVGSADGFSDLNDREALIERIRSSGADVLLVGLGNPLQESWIVDNARATGCKAAFAVGALLDFLAGEAPRAPKLVQRLRLEWAFRLALEPRRLADRYLRSGPRLLLRLASASLMKSMGGRGRARR